MYHRSINTENINLYYIILKKQLNWISIDQRINELQFLQVSPSNMSNTHSNKYVQKYAVSLDFFYRSYRFFHKFTIPNKKFTVSSEHGHKFTKKNFVKRRE